MGAGYIDVFRRQLNFIASFKDLNDLNFVYLLDQLEKLSTVVIDSADLELIRKFRPRDATTNPSIIFKTVTENPQLLQNVLSAHPKASVGQTIDHLLVAIGTEILKIIPGRVSTEIDAHLSFDDEATIRKAREIAALYGDYGITLERILIKIAATWEGIQAAKILEKEGIHCNMTLIFSLEQAAACAEAGVTLISPFVGRILDWYQAHHPEILTCDFDPGVHSVRRIFAYYKKWGYKTEIMAASFRSINEIIALAGCDLLTISPKLLNQLAETEGTVENRIHKIDDELEEQKMTLQRSQFYLLINENPMAVDKLAEGIRIFCEDGRQLEKFIATGL
ncbi:MAG: transaldolase [Puniceicoccales bacterium]|nr:transaldolase [Puniceicoccales bacterium]